MNSLYKDANNKDDSLVEQKPKVNLHSVLKAGYGNKKKQEAFAVEHGYIRDPMSNDNQQIYFHQPSKSLLVNVTGTHNIKDVGTDVALVAGKLQDTKRFKEAKQAIASAKQKYGVDTATLTAHSLGGGILQQGAGGKNDKVIVLDSAMTIGQKVNPKQTIYRSSGDIVSIAGAGNKNVKTIQGKQKLGGGLGITGKIRNTLEAHKIDNIKDKNIFI
jgi:hypothetical protein